MNKKIITLSAIVLIIIFYVGFWLFQSHQIKKNLSKIDLGNGVIFSSESVSVSGFPFYKNTHIKNAKISLQDGEHIVAKEADIKLGAFEGYSKMPEIKVSGHLVFRADDLGLVIDFNPDSKISIFEKSDKLYQLKIACTGYKISSEQTNQIIFGSSSTNSEIELELSENTFNYRSNDSGLKITNSKGETSFEADSLSVNIGSPKADNSNQNKVALDIKLAGFLVSENLAGQVANLDKNKKNLALKTEIIFKLNEEVAKNPNQFFLLNYDLLLNLNNFSFSDKDFDISVSGELAKSAIEKSPKFEFEAKIKDIDNILKKFPLSKASQDKFISIDEIIKQVANVNPASQDKVSVINIKMDKNIGNDVNFNDIGYKTIYQTLIDFEIRNQIEKLEQQKRVADGNIQQEIQAQINYLEMNSRPISTFDPKKIDPTTLNSKNIDVSKIDQSLGQEKINQFYQILLIQKNRSTELKTK